MTIPFRPVARSAFGSTSGEKADMAHRARPPGALGEEALQFVQMNPHDHARTNVAAERMG